MMKRLFTCTALLSVLTTTALAFDPGIQMTGVDFSKACTRADESWVSFCNGYVQAAIDSLREGDGICVPRGTTRTDIVTVTEKVITAVSELQAMNAYEAVLAVLRRSHPCS